MAGLAAGHRLGAEGHEVDVYERWPGLGGQAATIDAGDGSWSSATTTTCSRATARSPISARRSGSATSSRAGPRASRCSPTAAAPVHDARSTCCATSRCRCSRASGWASPSLLLQRRANDVEPFEADDDQATGSSARWAAQAWDEVWGPMLRGKFGDQADEISMSWLWAKLRNRRQIERRGGEGGDARLPAGQLRGDLPPPAGADRSAGGRVLIDRPAARVERAEDGGFLVHAGAPGLVPARPRPARLRGRRRARALRRGHRDPSHRHLRAGARPGAARRRSGTPTSSAPARSSTSPRSACCSSSTAGSTPTTGPTSPTRTSRFIGLIEQTNLVGPEHYGGRRFLYVANYLPRGHELLGAEHGRALGRLRARAAQGQPGLLARLDQAELALPRARRRSRSCCPTTATACRRTTTGVPGLCMANTTQVYPDDRGTNYAVREADEVVAALLAQRGVSPRAAAAKRVTRPHGCLSQVALAIVVAGGACAAFASALTLAVGNTEESTPPSSCSPSRPSPRGGGRRRPRRPASESRRRGALDARRIASIGLVAVPASRGSSTRWRAGELRSSVVVLALTLAWFAAVAILS